MRAWMRRTVLSQHTLEAILKSKAVRGAMLERARAAAGLEVRSALFA